MSNFNVSALQVLDLLLCEVILVQFLGYFRFQTRTRFLEKVQTPKQIEVVFRELDPLERESLPLVDKILQAEAEHLFNCRNGYSMGLLTQYCPEVASEFDYLTEIHEIRKFL